MVLNCSKNSNVTKIKYEETISNKLKTYIINSLFSHSEIIFEVRNLELHSTFYNILEQLVSSYFRRLLDIGAVIWTRKTKTLREYFRMRKSFIRISRVNADFLFFHHFQTSRPLLISHTSTWTPQTLYKNLSTAFYSFSIPAKDVYDQ
jgi:hypothetical protein